MSAKESNIERDSHPLWCVVQMNSTLEACCGTRVPGCGGTVVARERVLMYVMEICVSAFDFFFFLSLGSDGTGSQNTFFTSKLLAYDRTPSCQFVRYTQLKQSNTPALQWILHSLSVVLLFRMILKNVFNIFSTPFISMTEDWLLKTTLSIWLSLCQKQHPLHNCTNIPKIKLKKVAKVKIKTTTKTCRKNYFITWKIRFS